MKQRLKLALAVCSDTPLFLLDEPTANFDEQGIRWYHSLISRFSSGRTLIVCSNQPREYDFCNEQIGRAHDCTPITHAYLVCPLLLEKNILSPTIHAY